MLTEVEKEKMESDVNAVTEDSKYSAEWEVIKVCPDSGSCKFVCPLETAAHIPWNKNTKAIKNGVKYRAANGSTIDNEGEKKIEGYSSSGSLLASTWQGAKVTRALGGIKEMVNAGNAVTFDVDASGVNTSRIYNKITGVTVPIEDTAAGYEFEMWVRKPKKHGVTVHCDDETVKEMQDLQARQQPLQQVQCVPCHNKYAAFSDDAGYASFHRLVETQ